MKIQILISKNSWANQYKSHIKNYLERYTSVIKFFDNHKNLNQNYDINIIFSYFKIVPKKYLKFSKKNLIPHESRLPKGKGMSPLTWQILEKKSHIFFSLIEAHSKIDSGNIYYQKKVRINKNLIFNEIKKVQLNENLKLIKKFVNFYYKKNKFPSGKLQKGKSTYYLKRTPKNSKLNINKTIKNQFNLLRIADEKNYPSFFKLYGKTYILKIFKS